MFWIVIIVFLIAIQLSRGGVPREVIKLSRIELVDIKGISREEIELYESNY